MKITIQKSLFAIAVSAAFTACHTDKNSRGFEYMDDMYYSPAYNTYGSSDILPNEMSALTPANGTIARGTNPYEYPNSNEGYEAARTELTMPEKYKSEEHMKKGERNYAIFCAACHGIKGDGQGQLVEREKFLGVPGYDEARLPDITPGSAYHVIMHGKGMMGSHASQLTEDERWQIVAHVWKLRNEQKK